MLSQIVIKEPKIYFDNDAGNVCVDNIVRINFLEKGLLDLSNRNWFFLLEFPIFLMTL